MALCHDLLTTWATAGQQMTKYRRRFCNRVVQLGRRGRSAIEIAVALGVHRQTLRRWCIAHLEFAQALEFAHDCALVWWERLGHRQLDKLPPRQDPSFNKRTRRKHRRRHRLNEQLYLITLTTRFPREYGSVGYELDREP